MNRPTNRRASWCSTQSRALGAAVILAAVATVTHGQNLLTNGNFNTDTDGNPGPDAWTSWTYGTTAFAAYKADPASDPFDLDGTPYVNAGNYGDWWSSGGGWFQTVVGAENTAYSLSIDCSTEGWDNAAGELRIIYLDASNTEIRRDVYHTAEYLANQPWSPFQLTSTAPAGTTQVKAELATWGARGAVLWDNANLSTASVWNVDASGSWFTGTNWVGASPNGVDAAARFLGAITADQTVALDSPTTLGSLGFDNAHGYVLGGAGNITLQTSAGSALIDVKQGSQKINVPLTLASNTQINVLAGATLRVSDPLTVNSGVVVTQYGAGAVLYESSITLQSNAILTFGNSVHAGALALGAGAKALVPMHGTNPAKVLSVTSVTAAAGATLDVTDNPMIVDYTGGTSINNVRTLLQNGQVLSSAATAQQKLAYIESSKLLGASGGTFEGQTVDGTAVLLKLTYGGDANLDGKVDVTDLGALATSWQATGSVWSGGDFNYDGKVDVTDLGTLATNWQLGATAPAPSFAEALAAVGLSGVNVPEPTSCTLLLTSAALLARRRTR